MCHVPSAIGPTFYLNLVINGRNESPTYGTVRRDLRQQGRNG